MLTGRESSIVGSEQFEDTKVDGKWLPVSELLLLLLATPWNVDGTAEELAAAAAASMGLAAVAAGIGVAWKSREASPHPGRTLLHRVSAAVVVTNCRLSSAFDRTRPTTDTHVRLLSHTGRFDTGCSLRGHPPSLSTRTREGDLFPHYRVF